MCDDNTQKLFGSFSIYKLVKNTTVRSSKLKTWLIVAAVKVALSSKAKTVLKWKTEQWWIKGKQFMRSMLR